MPYAPRRISVRTGGGGNRKASGSVELIMMTRRSGALAAFTAVLLLAGCAGENADTGAGAPPGAPSSAPGAPVDPSAGVPVPDAGSANPSPGAVEKLTGPITAGVEPGCLILTTERGPHLLVSSGPVTKSLKAGTTMTVTGRAEPGMITTCQQGTPFVVTSVAPQ
jgi:hypothetical protein